MAKLIVKDNDFIEASLNLDVVEQRIIFLAIIKARQNSDNVEETLSKEFIIHASEYIETFSVERHTAYESLKNGVKGLLDAKFLYRYENKNNNLAHRGYNLASWVEYVDHEACVTIKFSPDVVPLIVGLNKKFTTYELQQIVNLQSRYAIRLYEMLIRWRDTRKLSISLDDLRFCLGIQNEEYQLMSNFKNRVLDLAVHQINLHTDIVANYQQKKEGRRIVGFDFTYVIKERVELLNSISEKPKTNSKRNDLKQRKTDQINLNDPKLEIAKSTADEYIKRKKITDENHKANIYKTAQIELWGSNESSENTAKEQNSNREKKILVDKIGYSNSVEKIKNDDLENYKFIENFENLSEQKQQEVLEYVQSVVKSIPIIGKSFAKSRSENKAHKDMLFRQYFKSALKTLDQER